jgi:hypothetical protein
MKQLDSDAHTVKGLKLNPRYVTALNYMLRHWKAVNRNQRRIAGKCGLFLNT